MPSGKKVLVVEDEQVLLSRLARALRHQSIFVDAVPDGGAAWELLKNVRYDLVVTDLLMPRMDGPTLMRRINQSCPTTRFIAITGHATMDVAIDCLRMGASDFLVKPFSVEEFVHTILNVLEKGYGEGRYSPNWALVKDRYGLTPRQAEVLKLLYYTGKTNQEIANDLRLSIFTVKSHIKSLLEKLGSKSRAEMISLLGLMLEREG